MMVPDLLEPIAVERRRRLDGRAQPDAHAPALWSRALQGLKEVPQRDRLETAYQFARQIEYRHEGLSAEIYFAHPLRVAALAILSGSSPDTDVGIVGLLHNALEVSDVTEVELERRFGASVSVAIRDLTVDRSVQWDATYKRSYYAALQAGSLSARVVKVLDKLDNLFLLGLNDDREVKTKYLREIVEYVVPMADNDLPVVAPYFRALVNETIRAEALDLPAL